MMNKDVKGKMSWTTIYITGKGDFREEVKKKLEHADQRFMPGYIENSSDLDTQDLYWIDGRSSLPAFKHAIGAKLIWKYRLRFFTTQEDFMAYENREEPDDTFTPEELSKIARMHALEERMS
jgi:hypothetical protein